MRFRSVPSFQFLGIPPKGELVDPDVKAKSSLIGFQFLGIPPKGERLVRGEGDDGA